MGVRLTDEQLLTVKMMAQYMENFADHLYHIMQNHGLDKINGFKVEIKVDPAFDYITKTIDIGSGIYNDSGYVRLTRGKEEKRYAPTGKNSAEYEWLFADETVRSRMEKILDREKPLPADGLWVGDDRNDPPVDCGEWDVNDSLS